MRRIWVFIAVLIYWVFPFSLYAQWDKVPSLTLQLKKEYDLNNLLNFEEVEAIISEKTLAEKELKVTLNVNEYFAHRNNECGLPVIRVDFPRKKLKGTWLEGFNKADILLICNNPDDNNSSNKLLLELWFYEIAGSIFKLSPLIRPIRIELEGITTGAIPALLLESADDMVARYNGKNLQLHLMQPWLIDQEAFAKFLIFQYFIGNNCWSLETLHSMLLLSMPERPPMPYPWDHSCAQLLDSASENGRFSAGELQYKTPCLQSEVLNSVSSAFKEIRDEIILSIDYIIFSLPQINEKLRQYTLQFFEKLDDPVFLKNQGFICPEEQGR